MEEVGAAWKEEGGKDAPQGEEGKEAMRVVETLVFIPYTKDSYLKKRLQEVDNMLGEAIGTPACRFVERVGGGTIMDLLGMSNP